MTARLLLTLLLAVALAGPSVAQTGAAARAAETRAILVLADFSDKGEFQLENQVVSLVWDRLSQGLLSHVPGLAERPTVVNTGQPDGRALLQALGIQGTPALVVADLDPAGRPRSALWQRKVYQPAVEVQAMLAYFGVDPEGGQPLIRTAGFQPQGLGRPLRAGEVVTITTQGAPGATVTATLGGRSGIPCFEDPPGLYRGTYMVSSEDRTNAQVAVDLRTQDGREEHRDLGAVAMQGVATPEIQLVQQVGPSQWMALGVAAPGSRVTVSAEVVQSALMFKDVQRQQFQGVADATGQFQALGTLQGDLSGQVGTFRVEATDPSGVVVRSEDRQIRLVADGRWQPQPRPEPWPPSPGSGVQAFTDGSGLYVVANGQRTQLESMTPRWYQAVADLVVYSSFMNDLKVWWRGQTFRLESMAPRSWKADAGTVAYVNFMGNFLVWYQGQATSLGQLPPESYEVGPGALAFVGANRGFFLWQPGSGVRQVDNWSPRSYRIYGRTLQYEDSGGMQRVVPF